MAQPLMPKATAVWLVDNTTLTFEQIATFCNLHLLEVSAIADDEVATGIVGRDPTAAGQITQEELDRCSADPSAVIVMSKQRELPIKRARQTRYTPLAKRQDKPDAIAWMIRNHSEISDAQIGKLLGTTKNTIRSIRENSHWNSPNIRPRDPVMLGLCTQVRLNETVARAEKKASRAAAKKPTAAKPAAAEPVAAEPAADEPAAAEPATAEPAADEPVATEPAAAEPAADEPAATEPAAAEPAADEPAATEPVAAEPTAAEPEAAEPVASEPAADEPTAAEPVVAEPVAAEPEAAEPPCSARSN